MEIKAIFNRVKKSFAQFILLSMVLIFLFSSLRYIKVLQGKDIPSDEKDLCLLVGIPWRGKIDKRDEKAFEELLNKKTNIILGIRPIISYHKLLHRNLFAPSEDLVDKAFTLKPSTLRIGIDEKFQFQPLHGIGPYAWKCEPENLGEFKENEFIARTPGKGKIIVTDARGHAAEAEVITASHKGTVVPDEKKTFVYHGVMKLITPKGTEILAVIEEVSSGKTHFKKSGEELGEFLIKDFSEERLTLLDKARGKEIELLRK